MSEAITLDAALEPDLIDLLFGKFTDRQQGLMVETDDAAYTFDDPLVERGEDGDISIRATPGSAVSVRWLNGSVTTFHAPSRALLDDFWNDL